MGSLGIGRVQGLQLQGAGGGGANDAIGGHATVELKFFDGAFGVGAKYAISADADTCVAEGFLELSHFVAAHQGVGEFEDVAAGWGGWVGEGGVRGVGGFVINAEGGTGGGADNSVGGEALLGLPLLDDLGGSGAVDAVGFDAESSFDQGELDLAHVFASEVGGFNFEEAIGGEFGGDGDVGAEGGGINAEAANVEGEGEGPVACVDQFVEGVHAIDGEAQEAVAVVAEPTFAGLDVAGDPGLFAEAGELAVVFNCAIANHVPRPMDAPIVDDGVAKGGLNPDIFGAFDGGGPIDAIKKFVLGGLHDRVISGFLEDAAEGAIAVEAAVLVFESFQVGAEFIGVIGVGLFNVGFDQEVEVAAVDRGLGLAVG